MVKLRKEKQHLVEKSAIRSIQQTNHVVTETKNFVIPTENTEKNTSVSENWKIKY